MAEYGPHPSRRWIEDPSDPAWSWFVFKGPHGANFDWHRSRQRTGGSLDLLRKSLRDLEAERPGFTDAAREIALKAIKLPDIVMVQKGIQVLCVVGTDADLDSIKALLKSRVEQVRTDTRACLFERGIRTKDKAG
jgi:hypothetical protein